MLTATEVSVQGFDARLRVEYERMAGRKRVKVVNHGGCYVSALFTFCLSLLSSRSEDYAYLEYHGYTGTCKRQSGNYQMSS